jgi:hypothetical protein
MGREAKMADTFVTFRERHAQIVARDTEIRETLRAAARLAWLKRRALHPTLRDLAKVRTA